MSAEVLSHNSSSLRQGASGMTLAVLSFTPGFVAGAMLAAKLLEQSRSSMEITADAQTMAICFAAWSIYLLYDLHRSNVTLTRVLTWGAIIGCTIGFLGFASIG